MLKMKQTLQITERFLVREKSRKCGRRTDRGRHNLFTNSKRPRSLRFRRKTDPVNVSDGSHKNLESSTRTQHYLTCPSWLIRQPAPHTCRPHVLSNTLRVPRGSIVSPLLTRVLHTYSALPCASRVTESPALPSHVCRRPALNTLLVPRGSIVSPLFTRVVVDVRRKGRRDDDKPSHTSRTRSVTPSPHSSPQPPVTDWHDVPSRPWKASEDRRSRRGRPARSSRDTWRLWTKTKTKKRILITQIKVDELLFLIVY